MKEANIGPMFACLYPGLCDRARALGYALAIHGSVVTDLDLIAVPWTDAAVSPGQLKDDLLGFIGALGYSDFVQRESNINVNHIPHILKSQGCVDADGGQLKPHGRMAWNLYLDAGIKIDLSIMPRQLDNPPVQG